MCSVTADFLDEFGSLNISFPLGFHVLMAAGTVTCLDSCVRPLCVEPTAACVEPTVALLFFSVICVIPPQIYIYLQRLPAHLWCHNALVKESKVSVAPFMLTWKSTCPSGNTVLNIDSVWVALQLPPRCPPPTHTPPNSQPVSMSPCMNACKWMFFVIWRLQSGGEAYLGNAVWLPNKHKQWL